MVDRSDVGWTNDTRGKPRIEGTLEISKGGDGILIGGDPAALRSLAKLLIWIANVDQNSLPLQPDGERFHVHLHASFPEGFNSLTPFSCETEICRLDAKGSGEFPPRYGRLAKDKATRAKRAARKLKSKIPKRSKSKGTTGKTRRKGR